MTREGEFILHHGNAVPKKYKHAERGASRAVARRRLGVASGRWSGAVGGRTQPEVDGLVVAHELAVVFRADEIARRAEQRRPVGHERRERPRHFGHRNVFHLERNLRADSNFQANLWTGPVEMISIVFPACLVIWHRFRNRKSFEMMEHSPVLSVNYSYSVLFWAISATTISRVQ